MHCGYSSSYWKYIPRQQFFFSKYLSKKVFDYKNIKTKNVFTVRIGTQFFNLSRISKIVIEYKKSIEIFYLITFIRLHYKTDSTIRVQNCAIDTLKFFLHFKNILISSIPYIT